MNKFANVALMVLLVGAVSNVLAAKQPYRQLFFDDQRLFVRENLERVYGDATLEGLYRDENLVNPYGWVWAVDGPDGLVHLMYMGEHIGNHTNYLAAAVSSDGIHFRPRNTAAESGIANPGVPNQYLPNPPIGEPAAVLADPLAPVAERYKLLFCDYGKLSPDWRVIDCVYSSPDLVRWTKIEGSSWNPVGTEPVLGAFYNDVFKCMTVMSRPDWGQRRVGITETKDWRHYTDLELCLQADSLDPALTEVYGMPSFPYEGYFIGFPHLYHDMPQMRRIKYFGGKMHCELAYSLNGRHWQRSLRRPFLPAGNPAVAERLGGEAKMLFLTSMRRDKDGSVLLYGTVTRQEHGSSNAAKDPKGNAIFIFRLRQDGFVGLKTMDSGRPGLLCSRALIWKGSELAVNLKAEGATCAIYPHVALGQPEPQEPIAGFGHADCTSFSGDSAAWRPQWKGGCLAALNDRLVLVELKFKNGTVYSFTADGIPQMEIEAERHRHFGKGFACPGF